MHSNRFLQIARKIARNETELFDTLMEFEKTRKIRTKTRVNFTIDRSTASLFRKYCRNKGYNMSAKIEQAMKNMTES